MKAVVQRILAMSMVVGLVAGTEGLMIDNFTIPNEGVYVQTKSESPNLNVKNTLSNNIHRSVLFSGGLNQGDKNKEDSGGKDHFASIGINTSSNTSGVPDGYSNPNMLVMQSKGYDRPSWDLSYVAQKGNLLPANFLPNWNFTIGFTPSGNANQINGNKNESIMPSLSSTLTLESQNGGSAMTTVNVNHVINGSYNLTYQGSELLTKNNFNWSEVNSANFSFSPLNGDGSNPALYSINSVQATPTPEPTTIIPLGLGIAGLALYQFKRRLVAHS